MIPIMRSISAHEAQGVMPRGIGQQAVRECLASDGASILLSRGQRPQQPATADLAQTKVCADSRRSRSAR
jgi:hypothetical protein